MEKLIELFKDYVDNHWTDTKDIEKEYWVIDDWQWFLYWTREYLYEIIVSKKFWFIKWLVENDKIKIPHELDEFPQIYWVDYNSNECKSDRLIMLLSISSSPIEYLISYLK